MAFREFPWNVHADFWQKMFVVAFWQLCNFGFRGPAQVPPGSSQGGDKSGPVRLSVLAPHIP